ncbi:hypothetical protein ACFWMJ_25495 [Streptomyces hawaiiensis]|uniref:hypothetical protein n=1 Tax=Streptomyces hawaiiensis TaxID=67305 RepID=UPI00365A1757
MVAAPVAVGLGEVDRGGPGEGGRLLVAEPCRDVRARDEELQQPDARRRLVRQGQDPVDDLGGARRVPLGIRRQGRDVRGPRERLLGGGPVAVLLTLTDTAGSYCFDAKNRSSAGSGSSSPA